MAYDETLEMVMEFDYNLLAMGISQGEIEAARRSTDGFIKTIDGKNYFLSQKAASVQMPDQQGERH